ncbi:helix-turn-helix domain-containing protein [Paenibacillus xylanexedens]|uniref:helix-turn-helix domain-containing protein n=1 Tax=Paenibacillus xylanexedens TaxID=528191 RepID=UPI0028D0DA12|nr:helix-turn-helix domain-containing protein [Paenibacillus xylanexedens]
MSNPSALIRKTIYQQQLYQPSIQKTTGLTIRNYILNRRIELAQICLSEGMSITEACYRSGFGDYANFIRSFTKIVGTSPGKFVRKQSTEKC